MPLPSLNTLSPREREVLVHIAEGRSLMDIARALHRSLKTIESHRLSLGKKLGASNRVELARIAIAHGLVGLPDPNGQPGDTAAPSESGGGDDPAAARWAEAIRARVGARAGADYLNALACAICGVVGVSKAGVGVPAIDEADQGRFRSLAHSSNGQLFDQFAYTIHGTPCETAMDKGVCLVNGDAVARFPADKVLSSSGAQAYAGVRLDAREGEAVGVLWVVHEQPLQAPESVLALLRQLAPQAAAEALEIRHTLEALRLCEQRGNALAAANRELRLHNQQLDQIASYYAGLAERMSDGLVVLDESWRIKYANQKFAELLEQPSESLLGKLATDLLTGPSREKFRSMQDARQRDEMKHYRLELLHADGGTRDVLVSPRTLYDEQGQFAGSFAVITDQADIEQA